MRVPHYHANTHELLYVTAGKISFINVEANNTFTKSDASAGFLVEQPKGVLHVVYNDDCKNATYSVFYTAANVTTYNVPYAMKNLGNFSIDATWYPQPALRYPNSVDKGLWAYNPECLKRCNIQLPSTFVDIQKQPQAINTTG